MDSRNNSHNHDPFWGVLPGDIQFQAAVFRPAAYTAVPSEQVPLSANSSADPRLSANRNADSILSANSNADPRLSANRNADSILSANSNADPRLSTNSSADPRLSANSSADQRLSANRNADSRLSANSSVDPRLSTNSSADPRLSETANGNEVSPDEVSTYGEPDRVQWSNPVEFLMSCIAMSVGLGNIWRFPFTAFDNGGGAFLIPYIIVLVVIGRPMYFMEMGLGQFTSYGAVKVWSVVPALKGLGWGMVFVTVSILTYYCSIMAITIFYFVASFNAELPWATCAPEWVEEGICFDSKRPGDGSQTNYTNRKSSSELYFIREVLKEKSNIEDGIGYPEWRLTLCLLISWITVFLVIIRGVKSTGKAAYFMALFPFVVLIALLIRGATLPGSGNGILFFIEPQWGELLNPKVWYAAVTQAFFSLGVSFGVLIMYPSHNSFTHNVYRDALIVTTLDTFTSLLAGCTIFAILGNLAHEMGVDDISQVVKGDAGLAFISYPEAIAKFDFVPQLFAVLFFLMMFTLGTGTTVGLASCVIGVICDEWRSLKNWVVALALCSVGFLSSLVYVTPGGQWILTLVDYYCVTFVVFVVAAAEMGTIAWVYGFDNYCRDMQFMVGHPLGIYWRVCWGVVTPIFLIVVFVYSVAIMEPKQYDNKNFPEIAYTIAWILAAIGILQIPIWIGVEWIKRRADVPFKEMVKASFRPSESWGPKDPKRKKEWETFKERKTQEDLDKGGSLVRRTWRKLTGFDETD